MLVGSPVRQNPRILEAFLTGLTRLDTQGLQVDFYFVDDNDEPASSVLLQSFAAGRTVHLEKGQASAAPYVCDRQTHHWKEELIWKVAGYKDRMIAYAVGNGYDYLFLADADLVIHPLTLRHLSTVGKDIVSEVFWTKWEPHRDEEPQVWLYDQYTMYEVAFGERLTQEEKNQRMGIFMRQLRSPGVYRVGGLGACTLISRRALTAGVHFGRIGNVTLWGEDRHFCVRAVALGLELHADTHLPPLHLYREPDLARVPQFWKGVPQRSEELLVIQAARMGLREWGTTDYRTVTGLEGAAYVTPALRSQRQSEAEMVVRTARETELIACTTTGGVQGLQVDAPRGTALVRVEVLNEGSERGAPYCDAFMAEARLVKDGDQWLIAHMSFEPQATGEGGANGQGPTAGATAQREVAAALQPGPTVFIPKAAGNKLVVSMVVRNESDRHLRRVISHAATYADAFVIVDDASTDQTVAVCREAAGIRPLTIVTNPEPLFHNEITLRKRQWELTLATKPDWILFLDADEIFEDRMQVAARPLMNQTNFDVVAFRLYDLWDDQHYREDGYWQAHKVYRPFLIRYRPDFAYRWRETPQHCGRMPANVTDLRCAKSDIRLKHYGWADPKDRQAKYERYLKLDPHGAFGVLGQYQSILDPAPHLVKWDE